MTMSNGAQVLLICGALFTFACSDDGSNGSQNSNDGGALPQCSDVCTSIMAAQCPNGPPTQSECTTLCQQFRTGACAGPNQTLFDCAGRSPNFVCDAQGFITVAGCETEYSALIACVSSP
jgi:hypothetical protein